MEGNEQEKGGGSRRSKHVEIVLNYRRLLPGDRPFCTVHEHASLTWIDCCSSALKTRPKTIAGRSLLSQMNMLPVLTHSPSL